MIDNHLYNLMEQIVQESKSLVRITKSYPGDAEGCEECENYWIELKKDKEKHIDEMMEMLKKHLA